MKKMKISASFKAALVIASCSAVLASCATTPPPCLGPQTRNLSHAVDDVKATSAAAAVPPTSIASTMIC